MPYICSLLQIWCDFPAPLSLARIQTDLDKQLLYNTLEIKKGKKTIREKNSFIRIPRRGQSFRERCLPCWMPWRWNLHRPKRSMECKHEGLEEDFFLLPLGVIPNAVLQFIFDGSAMSPSTDSRGKHFFSNQANYNAITANVMKRNWGPIQTLLEMTLTAYNSECWANTSYTIFLKKTHDASHCSMWIFLADINCHRGGQKWLFCIPQTGSTKVGGILLKWAQGLIVGLWAATVPLFVRGRKQWRLYFFGAINLPQSCV